MTTLTRWATCAAMLGTFLLGYLAATWQHAGSGVHPVAALAGLAVLSVLAASLHRHP